VAAAEGADPIQVNGDAVQIEPNKWLRLFNDRAPLAERSLAPNF
jgi:hypothetical protein